jgi:hypothetical protein
MRLQLTDHRLPTTKLCEGQWLYIQDGYQDIARGVDTNTIQNPSWQRGVAVASHSANEHSSIPETSRRYSFPAIWVSDKCADIYVTQFG